MPYFSNSERREAPVGYVPAQINPNDTVTGPKCCGQPMKDDGGCASGCCDDYQCDICSHTIRIEWPD